jgi:hypothetical protein
MLHALWINESVVVETSHPIKVLDKWLDVICKNPIFCFRPCPLFRKLPSQVPCCPTKEPVDFSFFIFRA